MAKPGRRKCGNIRSTEIMPRNLPASALPETTTGQIRLAGSGQITVSQLINQFKAWLEKPGNYPRLAKQFTVFCLANKLPLDLGSLNLYAAGKAGNQVSPVKKFIRFYLLQGCPAIVSDPVRRQRIPPAANELILGYLAEATHLRGDKTKETYTQALNAFFTYLTDELEMGRAASFSAQTIGQYINDLRERGLSAFTINFYLSALKQLAGWVIKQRVRLALTDQQADELRDVAAIRGLAIERGFYKDSLDERERDELRGVDRARQQLCIPRLFRAGLARQLRDE